MLIGIDASRAESKIKTGVGRYSYELIRALRESRPEGARVVLYSRVPLLPELGPFDDDWKNAVLRWPLIFLWTQIRLSWEMFRRPPDVLFVPSHELPRVVPKRTVKTVHDAFFMDQPRMFPLFERWFLKATLNDSCRRASEIIVTSNFVAKQIARWRQDRVTVIPLGVRVDKPSTTHKLQPTSYFIVVGRIEKKKNLIIAIEAFEKFSAQHPDYKLHFVGKFANGAEEIVKRAQTSSAKDNIEFLGAMPDEEMFPLLENAVALLHPCPFEGFGIPPVEAMVFGVPTIVANAGAVVETVGNAGLLADPDDAHAWAEAMENILDPAVREDLVRRGHERAARFTWEKAAATTWKTLTA